MRSNLFFSLLLAFIASTFVVHASEPSLHKNDDVQHSNSTLKVEQRLNKTIKPLPSIIMLLLSQDPVSPGAEITPSPKLSAKPSPISCGGSVYQLVLPAELLIQRGIKAVKSATLSTLIYMMAERKPSNNPYFGMVAKAKTRTTLIKA